MSTWDRGTIPDSIVSAILFSRNVKEFRKIIIVSQYLDTHHIQVAQFVTAYHDSHVQIKRETNHGMRQTDL